MPGKRHSRSEVAAILQDWSNGMTVEQAAKKHKVTIQTLYRWKREMTEELPSPLTAKTNAFIPSLSAKPQTLSELRAENARLKAVIADLLMEKYTAA